MTRPTTPAGARWRAACAAALLLLAGGAAVAQGAGADDPPRKAFRVCQDPNNPPFTDRQGKGIEQRIAALFAAELGLPVTFYSFPQRMAFIRNTLRFKLPDADYPCDIVMGLPAGFDQGASVTQPYYRSTYALVVPQGRGLDHVVDAASFFATDRAKLSTLRIGLYDQSPVGAWLVKHDLVDRGVPYKMLNADPDQYPGQIVEDDLAHGKIDVAVVWGPIAGFFAQRVKQPVLKVVPLRNEPGVVFEYEMAMGVRYGEPAWKKQIEQLIDAKRPQIDAILREHGVPQLPLQPAAARGGDRR